MRKHLHGDIKKHRIHVEISLFNGFVSIFAHTDFRIYINDDNIVITAVIESHMFVASHT